MNRAELNHIIRSTASIVDRQGIEVHLVVIGSQSILGTYSNKALPEALTMSNEADIFPVAVDTETAELVADLIDGAIGEGSAFHESFSVYGQGVDATTAVLPPGWVERLVPVVDRDSGARAYCLDVHDLCVAKLIAARPKDHHFVEAAVGSRLVDPETIRERLATTTDLRASAALQTLARVAPATIPESDRKRWWQRRAQAEKDRPAPPADVVAHDKAEIARRVASHSQARSGGYVKPYRRADGTPVKGHQRRR